MISFLGNWLQLTVMITSVVAIGYKRHSKLFFYFSCSAAVLSFLLLEYAFIVSDFSVQNVFLNSSTIKPLIYKIAGAWANHEGSMLLFLCLLAIVSFTYVCQCIKPSDDRYYYIATFSWILLLFSSYIYFTSNPFAQISFTPKEGLGLNPLLQDIALVIHPPILYLGYVSYIVPFAIACALLLKPHLHNANELKIAFSFSKFGIALLTLGIGLGSWWAYRELGWGGFWFFDPVENISLMPWLSAIALHHSLLITIKHKNLIKWSVSLSILTFCIIILSVFLVRSGLISSVHSFASSPERTIYILLVFSLIAIPGILLLCIKGEFREDQKLSPKENGIIVGNSLWIIALIIILSATIYPIIYSLTASESVSIGPDYFLNTFIPIFIPILFLAGLIPTLNLSKVNFTILLCSIVISLLIALTITIGIIPGLIITGAIFLFLQNLYSFIMNLSHNKGMLIGHIGFSILVISITLNSLLQKEAEFIGRIGDNINFESYTIKLHDIKFAESIDYYRQIAEFWVQNTDDHSITILQPENRLYKIEKTISEESDIYSFLTYDLYMVLSKVDDDIIHAKMYYRPFISFIWLSVVIMCAGFLVKSR